MLILQNKETQQTIVSNETIGNVFNQAFGLDINEVNDFVKQTQTNEIKNQIKVDFDKLSKSNPSTDDIKRFNKTRARWLANAGSYEKLRDTTLKSIAEKYNFEFIHQIKTINEITKEEKSKWVDVKNKEVDKDLRETFLDDNRLTKEWFDKFVALGNKNFVLKLKMFGETKWVSVKDGKIDGKWLEVQDTHKIVNSRGLRVVPYHWLIKAIIG